MISVRIQTLIVSNAPSLSVLVLQPEDEIDSNTNSRVVPIWIGVPEAAQLGLAIEQARLPRPMTHDLFLDALTNLDSYVDHVLINEVKGSTFFAKLVLRHHNRLIELDARPSDAITLAVRQGAPLYMLKSVLEKASYPFIFKKNFQEADETELEEFHAFIKNLTPEDFEKGC